MLKMKKVSDMIDYGLSTVSLTWALNDIEHYLSIILLILSLINLLYKFVRDIYIHIKNKEFDKIDDVIKDTIEELEQMKEGDIYDKRK